jgi:hypothetical protein
MANEGKDGLFSTNLGDGLIDVPETKEETVAEVATEEVVPKKTEPVKEESQSAVTQHEDGTIEIDEALQATIAASERKTEEDDDNIEKTESENKKETSSDGDDSGDSSPSSSQYLAFARDRANEGVFLDFNDEDWKVLKERNDGDEAAALRELSEISMQQRVKDSVEAYKESLTDEDRALYEAKEKGLPVDKYGKAKQELKKWSEVKPDDIKENEKLQIEIVSKGLELRGFSKEEIAEEIDGYKALENLESKAEKILPLLPKKFETDLKDMEESAAADEQSRKDRIRQGVAKMKQTIDNTPEIIPGIKLTKPTREKIMKSMTEPVARDAQGNPLNPVMATKAKNPEAFEMMVHYFHELGFFNIDENGQMKPDFSKIVKTAKNEATDTMRTIFESNEKQVSGKPKVVKKESDELDDFDEAFARI